MDFLIFSFFLLQQRENEETLAHFFLLYFQVSEKVEANLRFARRNLIIAILAARLGRKKMFHCFTVYTLFNPKQVFGF